MPARRKMPSVLRPVEPPVPQDVPAALREAVAAVSLEAPRRVQTKAGTCIRCRRLVRGVHVLDLDMPGHRERFTLCAPCAAELFGDSRP